MIYKLAEKFKDLKNELDSNDAFDVYTRDDFNETLIQPQINNVLYELNGEEEEGYVPDYKFGLDDSFKELVEATWRNVMLYKCTVDNETIWGSYAFNHPLNALDEKPWLTDLIDEDNKDYDVIKNLRIFDNTNVKYQFGCINYKKGDSKDIFENEIYLFHDEHLIFLNLTFREYLESCAELLACENWQMLFANPAEVARYTKELNELKKSYTLLSKIFPEKDFELFRKKLTEHNLL